MDHSAISERIAYAIGGGFVALVFGIICLANATGDAILGPPETSMPLLIAGYLFAGGGGMLIQAGIVGWVLTAKKKSVAATQQPSTP